MADNTTEQPTRYGAELPKESGRLVIMVLLACTALVLAVVPLRSPVEIAERPVLAAQTAAVEPTSTAAPMTSAPVPSDTTPSTIADQAAPAALASTESESVPAEPAAVEADSGKEQEAEPETDAAVEEVQEPAGGGFVEDFSKEDSRWNVLTGSWSVIDGEYVQETSEGFDYIALFDAEVPEEFAVAVDMQALSEGLGGGILLGQPSSTSRRGAYIVDFASGGSFLRWGRYDPESGAYSYIGGLNVGTEAADPHKLRIEAQADTTLVYLDDVYIGAFDPIDPDGMVGLVTSESSVAFDNFVVEDMT